MGSFQPPTLSASTEEAKNLAAETALHQLNVPLDPSNLLLQPNTMDATSPPPPIMPARQLIPTPAIYPTVPIPDTSYLSGLPTIYHPASPHLYGIQS